MCGIYGIWEPGNRPAKAATILEALGKRLQHRGPDDAGHYYFEETGLALGHRRLSIVDLSPAGRQPMRCPQGRYILSFNGEIYNYRELRSELENLGHTFRTETDTEVLLAGYTQWQVALFPRLAGMFALALVDTFHRQLLLVRDPTGVKPLVYSHGPGYFGFASEVKAFLDWPTLKLQFSDEAQATFLEFGYLYDSTSTMFQGVRKVPPGSLVRVYWPGADRIQVEPPEAWWRFPLLELDCSQRSWDELAEELHQTLEKVVRSQLQADVPVGLLLSGGLDSSLLAAYATRVVRQPLRTLCMGFADAPLDERIFARQVAEHLGSEHHELFCTRADVLAAWHKHMLYYDDLFWDTGFLSSMLLYRKCRDLGLKVMLVGEGADELFAGYTNFRRSLTAPLRWIPGLFRYYQYRYRSGQQWGQGQLAFDALQNQLLIDTRFNEFQTIRQYELQHQIPNNLNMKVDHASMASSVEARVPFQDPRLLQQVLRWPASVFLQPGSNKHILRYLAQKYSLLPAAIRQRPKFGMMMPGNWLDEPSELRSQAQASVLKPGGVADRFGLRKAMTRFFAGHAGTHGRHLRKYLAYNTVAWRLTILALWKEAWMTQGVRD